MLSVLFFKFTYHLLTSLYVRRFNSLISHKHISSHPPQMIISSFLGNISIQYLFYYDFILSLRYMVYHYYIFFLTQLFLGYNCPNLSFTWFSMYLSLFHS